MVDPPTLGFCASIGIQKGKPFAPDARMKQILTEAAAAGAATARAISFRFRGRGRDGYGYGYGYGYDNANWRLPFVGGYTFDWQPGVANLDAAAFIFNIATGVTPAMDTKIVGECSIYPWNALDANNTPLDGGKNDRLRLPPTVPAKDFGSGIVYSAQTRSMVQTNQQFPSLSSQNKNLPLNGPLLPWFHKTLRPGEMEPL